MKSHLLSLFVAAALAVPPASAAAPAAGDDARRAELAKARAALAENARRVAELSRELGDSGYAFHFEDGERARPGVGIVMEPDPAAAGVRLAAVTPDGPAAKAGLRAGDVLRSVDGTPIAGSGDAAIADARDRLSGLKAGQRLRLGYARQGRSAEATVTVAEIGRVMRFGAAAPEAEAYAFAFSRGAPVIAPGVEMEIARLAAAPCAPGAEDCHVPLLARAFRWNGLNLAPVDARLGRYFGTERGVLVLSGGDALDALEPGDVIRSIEGVAVDTPRDAMRALREHETGAKLEVVVLRDRKPRTVTVTVPDAAPLRMFAPPPPPPPPAPPAAPRAPKPPKPPVPPRGAAAPPPPAPPAPAAPPAAPAPPAPPSPPSGPDVPVT